MAQHVQPSSSFSTLPDEMMTKILSYLSLRDLLCGVRAVDRRFRCLYRENVTWIDMGFPSSNLSVMPRRLAKMLPNFTRLRWLKLCCWKGVYGVDLEGLAIKALRLCPMLEGLTVAWVGSSDLFDAIKQHGKSLRRIDLTGASWPDQNVFRNLTHVKLEYCSNLNDKILISIGRECQQLESFAACIGRNGGYVNSSEAIKTFLDTVKETLKTFCWEGSISHSDNNTWTSQLSQCQRLETVRVALSKKQVDAFLEATVLLPSLKHLGLGIFYGSDAVLPAVKMSRMGEQLATLTLASSGSKLVRFLTGRVQFPGLLHLVLDDPVSDSGFRILAGWCGETVEVLSLGWGFRTLEQALSDLAREGKMPRLKRVNIRHGDPGGKLVRHMKELGIDLLVVAPP